MTISLKQLKYFDAVARAGSFGGAAEQCFVTQPALSMQIQALEQFLGAQLMERGRNGIVLTAPGREIADRAAKVLRDVRDIVDFARSQGETPSGPLHLGVIPSVAPYLLPPLLPLVQTHFPDLDLRIRETQTRPLVHELLGGDLDLLLLALPVDAPEVETAPLFEDRFLLAIPRRWPMPKAARATPELIERDRLLLLEEGHCLRDQALAFCNLRNTGAFGSSSLSTIAQMVANGLGITLLPELCAPLENRQDAMRLLRFADPEPKRTIGLAWRRASPRKHHFLELGRKITEAAATPLHASRQL